MADIRINSLPTTASASSSDDFLALDGATNGTRKLNAYSPTFGGNLTVTGTGAIGGSTASQQLHVNVDVFGASRSGGMRIGNSGNNYYSDLLITTDGSANPTLKQSFATHTLSEYAYAGGANSWKFYTNNTLALTINSSQSATLSGNLTVSGTVAASGDLKLGVAQTSQFSANRFSIINSSTNNQKVSYELMVNDGTDNNRLAMFVDDNAHTLGFDTGTSNGNYNGLSFSIEGSPKLLIDRSGNVLIGTTVDSSALLQVGTNTTTAAGGMKFGTDTSLYRSQTGMLALDGLTGSLSQLDLRVGGVQKAFVAWNGGDFYLGAVVGTTVIKSSNTTALTLDSSQNATFAGDVGLSGNEKYLNLFSTYSVGSNSRARLRAVGSGGGSGYGGSFTVDTRTSGNTFITALTIDDAQNATFAGTILTATNAAKNAIVARYNSSNSLFGVTVNSAGQGVISENNDASTGSDKYSKTGLPAFRLGNTGGSGTVPFWIDVAASGTAGNAITWTNAFQIDSSQNATFAGQITASGISHKLGSGGTGSANALLTIDGSSASSYGPYIVLQRNSTNKWQFGTYSGINGGTSDDFLLYNPTAANEALKIAAATSNATFAGGIIGMTQGNVDNISDDGVASFTPLYNRGFIVINNPDYSQNALIAYFKAGSSYLLYSITKSADVTLNNSTTLTGTTGTDGKLNIGYNNSIIYIENRLGGIGNFQRYALGGTNN
jgi:hypothetical protein